MVLAPSLYIYEALSTWDNLNKFQDIWAQISLYTQYYKQNKWNKLIVGSILDTSFGTVNCNTLSGATLNQNAFSEMSLSHLAIPDSKNSQFTKTPIIIERLFCCWNFRLYFMDGSKKNVFYSATFIAYG